MKWSSFNDCVLQLNEFVYVLVYPPTADVHMRESQHCNIQWSQKIISMSWSASQNYSSDAWLNCTIFKIDDLVIAPNFASCSHRKRL